MNASQLNVKRELIPNIEGFTNHYPAGYRYVISRGTHWLCDRETAQQCVEFLSEFNEDVLWNI